ncbi:hypothetical protein LCGC14_1307800, partial [marine sediment metagenome]
IQNLWKIVKSDLTKQNLQNIDPKITIEDLTNWYIIEEVENNYIFHERFVELIEFLRIHPELYPMEFKIIKENLISWIKNSILSDLVSKNVRFTVSGKNIQYFKNKLEDIDWIYKIKCQYDRSELNLFDWATKKNYKFNTYSKDENLYRFLSRFIVLIAPAGYGKSVLLNQLSIELLTNSNLEKYKVVPLYLSLKKFQVKNDKIFYAEKELIEVSALNSENIDSKNFEFIFTKLLDATLLNYQTNELMLKIFFSNLIKHRILLILDGWDELSNDLRVFLGNFLRSVSEEKDTNSNMNFKILIASRYTETHLNSIISRQIDLTKAQKFTLDVKLPEESDIFNYLTLVSSKIKTKEEISELKAKFHGSLTPLDLFLLGIFPQMDLPQYKAQLYERWIYYQILTDVIGSIEFNKIKSDEDIRVKLESIKLSRELDDHSFYLSQLIGGNIKGSEDINYSILEILPRISYSIYHPNIIKPIRYLDAIMSNPLLKRFISPYYKDFQRYAKLIDPHFYPYFLAKYIFQQFLDNNSVEPIPHSEVEDLLIDLFKQNSNNPKFIALEISKPEHFPYYLYLQSGIVLPALQLPYEYGELNSVPLSSISLRYGIYIVKTFQSEFRKAIENKNSVRKTKILDLFEIFEKRRPTKTIGSYMDEYSKDSELGEPVVNYTPLDYFDTIVQLLDLDTIPKKSGVEIKYLKKKSEYYMNHSFNYSKEFFIFDNDDEYYWRNEDLRDLLMKIFETDNLFLMPWYARIFPQFKNRKRFSFELNDDLIIKKYKKATDHYIKESLNEILINNNPKRAILESELFLASINDSKSLRHLIINYIECWANCTSLTKENFQIWIKYFQHPSITTELKYVLVRYLYNIVLDADQVSSLWSIYINEQKLISKIKREDYYYSIEENPEELRFIFNCLILLNYHKGIKKPSNYFYNSLAEREFLIDYVYIKQRYFYLKLLLDSNYKTKEELSKSLKNLGFGYIFSYSSEVFDNLWYDAPFFKQRNKSFKDIYQCLLQIQEEWWDDHKPNNYAQLKALLVEIFKFYRKNEGKWHHYTCLGSSYVDHEKEEFQPEIIQINMLLDFLEKEKPEFKSKFAQGFFGLLDEYFLKKIDLEERQYYRSRYKSELPLFIRISLKKLKKIDSNIRKEWIKRLLELKIGFKEYKELTLEEDDYRGWYDEIWEGSGKMWIGDKQYVDYLRTSKDKDRPKEDDEFVYRIPFEVLIEKIKLELNWKDITECKNLLKSLQGKDKLNEESKEFLNGFFIFVDKLAELAQLPKFLDKAQSAFLILWNDYYPLWTEFYKFHPYTPYMNMSFVLDKLHNFIINLINIEDKPTAIKEVYHRERHIQECEVITPEDMQIFLSRKNIVSQKTREILDNIIPSYYIDDRFRDEKIIPNTNLGYKKDIFWFLVALMYKKGDYYKKKAADFRYHHRYKTPIPYLKQLIFDGIQNNLIIDWYNDRPESIPYKWIVENLDPLIIEHVFFSNHIKFIPELLRPLGRLHAWKYIVLSDLVNRVEQYFGAYREEFPYSEYEKSYISEDNDYSGFLSGIY